MNEYLARKYVALNEVNMDLLDKDYAIEGLEELPDGVFTVFESNKKKLNYRMHNNDVHYFQYHRNNGVTKLGLVIDSTTPDVGNTNFLLRTSEGAMVMVDRLNNAYISSVFNNTHVISGQQYMPFYAQVDAEVQKVLNFIGIIMFSINMSLTMPIFLNHLVTEKEKKLVDNMKTNGLKMYNYWIVNGCFYYFFYLITVANFYLFGRYIFVFECFKDTHPLLWAELLLIYGFSQVTLAIFYCPLFSNAQAATMTAYTISIWLCGFIADLTMFIFQYPERLPEHWQLYPNVTFVRAIYLLLNPCTWEKCYGNFNMAVAEFHEMNLILLGNAIFYGVVGLYLNEVVPQTYGVPKHPLFPVEGLIRLISTELHDYIFNKEKDLKFFRDHKDELNDEDQDV